MASSGLPWADLGLPEAGSGLVEACLSLPEAHAYFPVVGLGPPIAGPSPGGRDLCMYVWTYIFLLYSIGLPLSWGPKPKMAVFGHFG